MARFEINEPIATTEPTIVVENELAIGGHHFRLEVIDRLGRRSTPNDAIVQVQRIVLPPRPPAPSPIDPTPRLVDGRATPSELDSSASPPPRPRSRRKKETS
jgi:hypothetical protein